MAAAKTRIDLVDAGDDDGVKNEMRRPDAKTEARRRQQGIQKENQTMAVATPRKKVDDVGDVAGSRGRR